MFPAPHLKHAAALALALGAIVPATATARPVGADPTPFTAQTTPIVHVSVPGGGFDWADAGIGAAGGLAITTLGVGAGLTVSQRQARPAVVRAPVYTRSTPPAPTRRSS